MVGYEGRRNGMDGFGACHRELVAAGDMAVTGSVCT